MMNQLENISDFQKAEPHTLFTDDRLIIVYVELWISIIKNIKFTKFLEL